MVIEKGIPNLDIFNWTDVFEMKFSLSYLVAKLDCFSSDD